MLRSFLPFTFIATLSLAVADPLDTATLAAMRLSEAPNYSWSSSVTDDARSYVKSGKHLQIGYTWVMLPMLESISQRLGREAGTEVEAIFGASNNCVIRLGNRWKTVRQLPKASRGSDEIYTIVMPGNNALRTPDMSADMSTDVTEPDHTPPVIVITPPSYREEDGEKPFSNASLVANPPHEELALIVSSWENVKVEGDRVTGVVNETGARLLLCPGRDLDASPLVAAGQFTLHLKDNCVARYELKLEGVLRVGKKKKVMVRQTSETKVHAVGTTAFVLPDEARLKLNE